MTRFQGKAFASIITLVAAVAIPAVPATARDGAFAPSDAASVGIPVTLMPPVMRAAYLKGIRDELIVHGYDPGRGDDAVGHQFKAAIRRYQRDAGLPPDGIASKALLDHLLFALPKVYANRGRGDPARPGAADAAPMALAPPAIPRRQPPAEPVPAPAPRGRVSAAPLPDAGRSREAESPRPENRHGLSAPPRPADDGGGGFVSRTQRALQARGYYDGPIDGRFGDGLAGAIRAFQKDNRLPVTGVIDGPLLEALS